MDTNRSPGARESPTAARPLIFIGIDGAEPSLLNQWMDSGDLPVLARLRGNGICENVQTFRGFGDGAVWPSLLTGLNPARHGRYFRNQFRQHSYRRRSFSVDSDLVGEPFWTTLSKAGRRVAVLDVPFAPLQRDINGVLLIDWLMHDRYGVPRSWPHEFVDDVLKRIGDDPINGNCDVLPKDAASLARLSDLLIRRVNMKEALVTETLGAGQWDLVATAFTEAHDLGHVGWHLHDPSHPQHHPDWLTQHGDPIKRLYVEIDRAIGRILANARPETVVVIFAGLGMGPDYTANGVMEQILARLDERPYKRTVSLSKRLKVAGFPHGVARIGQKFDTVREILRLSRCRFFALEHNEISGAIRINLRGREPTGRVPLASFDAVCNELIDAFMEIENVATGRAVVDSVVQVNREVRGPFLDSMPDLLVIWKRDSPFPRIRSPKIGQIEGVRSWGRTGDHTANALLMVHGDDIQRCASVKPPSVVDVAATIGALQGVALPGIDGHSVLQP